MRQWASVAVIVGLLVLAAWVALTQAGEEIGPREWETVTGRIRPEK